MADEGGDLEHYSNVRELRIGLGPVLQSLMWSVMARMTHFSYF